MDKNKIDRSFIYSILQVYIMAETTPSNPFIDPNGALQLMCVACKTVVHSLTPYPVNLDSPPDDLSATGQYDSFMAQVLLHIASVHRLSAQTIDISLHEWLFVLEMPIHFLVIATYNQGSGKIKIDETQISSFRMPKK